MRVLRENKFLIAWIVFAIYIGLLGASQASLLNFDDLSYMQNYLNEMEKWGGGEKGWNFKAFLHTILSIGLNADILADTGDLRTYGLSRLIHVLIMLVGNNNPYLYQFIIGFTHVVSGYLVYILLLELRMNKGISCCAGMLWSISPFARVQTFHHWSYLMLPLYVLLFFFWYIIKRIHLKYLNKVEISFQNYFCSGILMFCIIFTGEYTLVPLFTGLILFSAIFYKKDKKLFKWFCSLFFIGIFVLIVYIVIYQLFINRSDVQRFNVRNISIIDGLRYYGKSVIFAIKTFLLLPNARSDLYPSKFNINSLRYTNWVILGSIVIGGCIAWAVGLFQLRRTAVGGGR